MFPVHFTAVIIASVVAFILQFLISGPLFGRLRMRLEHGADFTEEKPENVGRKLVLNFLATIITAYFIALYYLFFSSSTYGGAGVWQGIECAVMLWFGFLVAATSIDVIWGKKLAKVWLFEIVAALVVYAVMGAVIGFIA
jgi:hypothetical protein